MYCVVLLHAIEGNAKLESRSVCPTKANRVIWLMIKITEKKTFGTAAEIATTIFLIFLNLSMAKKGRSGRENLITCPWVARQTIISTKTITIQAILALFQEDFIDFSNPKVR